MDLKFLFPLSLILLSISLTVCRGEENNERGNELSGNLVGVVLDDEAREELRRNGGDLAAILGHAGLLDIQPILDDPSFIERRPYPIGSDRQHKQRGSAARFPARERGIPYPPQAVQFQHIPGPPGAQRIDLSQAQQTIAGSSKQVDLSNARILPFDQAPESIRREIEKLKMGGLSQGNAQIIDIADVNAQTIDFVPLSAENVRPSRARSVSPDTWSPVPRAPARATKSLPAPAPASRPRQKIQQRRNSFTIIHARSKQNPGRAPAPPVNSNRQQETPQLAEIPWRGPPLGSSNDGCGSNNGGCNSQSQQQNTGRSSQRQAPAPPVESNRKQEAPQLAEIPWRGPSLGSSSQNNGCGSNGGCNTQNQPSQPPPVSNSIPIHDIPWQNGPSQSPSPRAPAPPVKGSSQGIIGPGCVPGSSCSVNPSQVIQDIPWRDNGRERQQPREFISPPPATKPQRRQETQRGNQEASNGCGGQSGGCNGGQSSTGSIPIYDLPWEGPPIKVQSIDNDDSDPCGAQGCRAPTPRAPAPPVKRPVQQPPSALQQTYVQSRSSPSAGNGHETIVLIPEDSLHGHGIQPGGIESFPLILAELVPASGERGGNSYGEPSSDSLPRGKVLLLPVEHLQSLKQSSGTQQSYPHPVSQGKQGGNKPNASQYRPNRTSFSRNNHNAERSLNINVEDLNQGQRAELLKKLLRIETQSQRHNRGSSSLRVHQLTEDQSLSAIRRLDSQPKLQSPGWLSKRRTKKSKKH